MTHGSLFSGIGGFDLAAQWMGWENVFQVEWDDYCQKVLAKNFPDTLRFGDIVEFNNKLENGEIITDTKGNGRKINGNEDKESKDNTGQIGFYEESVSKGREMGGIIRGYGHNRSGKIRKLHIDIITGGFPCQPFSHAGKRNGVADERYLWPEMLRTIRILKPSYVVGENVAGLVSMENGKTLDTILSDLENEGYTTEQVIIPACAVGAWHRRDRIWIIGYRNVSDPKCYNTGQIGDCERTCRKGGATIQTKNKGWEGEAVFNNGLVSLQRNESQDVSDPRLQRQEIEQEQTTWIVECGEDVTDSQAIRLQGSQQTDRSQREKCNDKQLNGCNRKRVKSREQWSVEPAVGRVANGIPNRVDRLKGLGNAIVPQVAYQIFKAIEQLNQNQNETINSGA